MFVRLFCKVLRIGCYDTPLSKENPRRKKKKKRKKEKNHYRKKILASKKILGKFLFTIFRDFTPLEAPKKTLSKFLFTIRRNFEIINNYNFWRKNRTLERKIYLYPNFKWVLKNVKRSFVPTITKLRRLQKIFSFSGSHTFKLKRRNKVFAFIVIECLITWIYQ